ncbi:hypothetical protein A0256_22705 [Mucilaginibacter sp. PAMC 26640]|nr:hypothetical protein A0256_22705 [Mucilaginibacter sp. PAMC 26640]
MLSFKTSAQDMPLFSIITATFNSEHFLKKSIDCLKQQTYTDFEYIVIDGNSTDSTTSIIKSNLDVITKWISEPDQGIYDAWNKGLSLATGSWIMFVGADDYLRPDALSSYADFIKLNQTEDVLYISSKNQIISAEQKNIRVFGWPWNWNSFRRFNTIAHPGSLQSKKLYEKYGKYDTSYKIVGDYELLLRPREKLNALFYNNITIDVTEGGVSNQAKMFYEIKKAVVSTAGVSPLQGSVDCFVSILKINLKKAARKLGLNLYLKKSH